MINLEFPIDEATLPELESALALEAGQPETVALRILKEACFQLRLKTAPPCDEAGASLSES